MTGLTKLPRNTPPTLHTIKHAYIESQVDVQIQLYISLQFLRTLYNKGHPETHKKTNVNYLTLNPEFNETLQFPLDGRKIAEINLRLAIVHKSRTKKRYTQIGEASLDPLLFKSIQTGEPTQEWVQLLPALSDK
jgi:Ca2+-dependent lipid-binding protein